MLRFIIKIQYFRQCGLGQLQAKENGLQFKIHTLYKYKVKMKHDFNLQCKHKPFRKIQEKTFPIYQAMHPQMALWSIKAWLMKGEQVNQTSLKPNIFALQASCEEDERWNTNQKKIFQSLYPARALYLEYMKNSQYSTVKTSNQKMG